VFDPTLYFVSPPISDDLHRWEHLIKEAVWGGVTMVQIRDKTCSTSKMMEAAQRLHPFLKERRVPLLINDRVDIAFALELDGVHLGQEDLPVAEARLLLGSRAIIGISLENSSQIKTAEGADYIAASPVFPSKTKMTPSFWGLEGLKALRKEIATSLIAIGGIEESNLLNIWNLGVDGIAVVSLIAHAPCPRKAAERLIKIINSHLQQPGHPRSRDRKQGAHHYRENALQQKQSGGEERR
jgi:thiamine-phosphate diphosphorylase